MNPILRWPGGKGRHLKSILPLIPKHTCYVELFAGGLAVFLAKGKSEVEVVNDINRDLVSLYRCAQYHPDALFAEIEFALSSRANIVDFKTNHGMTELQRAARFLIANRTSFGGGMTSFAVQKKGGGGSTISRAAMLEMLRALNRRLDRVAIENIDWERCLKLYDDEETFFFIDPPYLHAKVNNYAGWDEAQMLHLREVLRGVKGQWILTVDASDFCKETFAEWVCREVESQNGAVNQRLTPGVKFSELIITPTESERGVLLF